MDSNGKAATAFLLGIIVGGVTGILFAPKSGRETRDHMQRYVKDTGEKFGKKKDDLKRRFGRAMDAARETGEQQEG